ncbi:MAG: acyl carrier protein [Candidatus Gastranaerophilales bacterium]|nr:acyl carrier protein [Candidatus Gastranaerophilales bacterium]
MERSEILNVIQDILRDVLEDDEIVVSEELCAKDVHGWDSLTHVNIIEVIEKKFNVKFTIGEIVVLNNIAGLIDLIQSKMQ